MASVSQQFPTYGDPRSGSNRRRFPPDVVTSKKTHRTQQRQHGVKFLQDCDLSVAAPLDTYDPTFINHNNNNMASELSDDDL